MILISQIFFDIIAFAVYNLMIVVGFCIFKRFDQYKALWSIFNANERFILLVYFISICIQMRGYEFYEHAYKATNLDYLKIANLLLFIFLFINFIALCFLLKDATSKRSSVKIFILAMASCQVSLAFSITSLPELILQVKIFAYIVGIQFPAFCVYITDELYEIKKRNQ